jgi:HMG (high mobility group) box
MAEEYIQKTILSKEKYDNNDINILLEISLNNWDKTRDYSYLTQDSKHSENFLLEDCFVLKMIKYNNRKILIYLIKNKKIKNPQLAFDLIFEVINDKKCYKSITELNDYINIWKILVENNNIILGEKHLEIVCKYSEDTDIILYFLNNMILTEKHLEIICKYSEDTDIILHFLNNNIILTEKHLENACQYTKNINIISFILNNKVSISKECINLLFSNAYQRHDKKYNELNNHTFKEKMENNFQKIIDLFVKFGYKLSDDDIILATKEGIILNDSIYTRNFVPTDEFYKLCNKKFKPIYNETIEKNIDKKIEDFDKIRKEEEKIQIAKNNEFYLKEKAKRKKEKKKKLRGFFLFSEEKREEVRTANPGISFGDTARKLGEMWRALSLEEKQKYKYKF